MSRTIRRQLFELIQSLKDANKYIDKLIQEDCQEELLALLMDCQDSAIAIGNKIEKIYGDHTQSVHMLEEYCEMVYQFAANTSEQKDRIVLCEQMTKQLLDIEKCMENEIPDKLEVVFLPYKASMWDSLESVWMAARDDENCEDYVVPIPYFDKNPDGTFADMHYEGEEYPDYVPVTSWKVYNLEERRPDVVYIHNPYDDMNIVTSVHPAFYSSTIKNYTEKLVYIPYFVLMEVNVNDRGAIEGIRHFAETPGVLYADKVIVQSENMKKAYMQILMKDEHDEKKRIELFNKIDGTGSPKIQKLLFSKKESIDIPDSWLGIIRKDDGGWKRIIIYNTSVAPFLQNSIDTLNKIEDVLRLFKLYKTDIALLWRPHPLLEATIKSMRPQLWERYSRIVKSYKKEGWGIYDDSSDLDRALVMSDAYYGDGSSVAHIYKALNKPILLANSYQESELVGRDIEFENLFDDGECLWFTSYHFNGLFKMNKEDWKTEYVGCFQNEDIIGFRLYSTIIEYGHKLFFTPLRANEIGIYDKKEKNIYKIPLQDANCGNIEEYSGWNFYSSVKYEDNIYMFPHQKNAILKFDIEKEKVEILFGNIVEKFFQNRILKPRIFSRVTIEDGMIYAPVSGDNKLVVIDIKQNKYHIYEVGESGDTYSDVVLVGKECFLAPLEGSDIIVWNLQEKKVVRTYRIEEKKTERIQFMGIQKWKNKLYFFPEYHSVIEIYDIETQTIQNCKDNVFDLDFQKNAKYMNLCAPTDSEYICCYCNENSIYAYNYYSRRLVELNNEKSRAERIGIDLKSKDVDKFLEYRKVLIDELFKKKTELNVENSMFVLEDFFGYVLHKGL